MNRARPVSTPEEIARAVLAEPLPALALAVLMQRQELILLRQLREAVHSLGYYDDLSRPLRVGDPALDPEAALDEIDDFNRARLSVSAIMDELDKLKEEAEENPGAVVI